MHLWNLRLRNVSFEHYNSETIEIVTIVNELGCLPVFQVLHHQHLSNRLINFRVSLNYLKGSLV